MAPRFGFVVLSVPVLFFCLLGLVSNWPVDCGPGGCGADSLAGSRTYATLFGVALAIGIAGAAAMGLKGGVKTGGVLLSISAALTILGIMF